MSLKATSAGWWWHPHRDRWMWVGFSFAALAYFVFRFLAPRGFSLYAHAAECMWNLQNLQECELYFTYPPIFAFVMLPFVAMPVWAGTLIWYLITLTCTVLCCWLCETLTVRLFPGEWPRRERESLRLFAILLGLKFILAVYEDQSYDLLALPLTLFGILALTDRRNIPAALSLAAAAALKMAPLIFLPYFLFKRRFVAAGVFVVALLSISFLPDLFFQPQAAPHGYFITWLREVAAPGLFEDASQSKFAFWNGANRYNLSLRGAVALAVDRTRYEANFVFLLRSVQLVFIAVMGVLFMAASRAKLIPIEGALLIISMLMLAPMTGRSHFVALLLPYYLIVAGAMRDRKTAGIGIACLAASYCLSGIPREIVPRGFSEFMAGHSDIVYGTLVLVVYVAVIITSPKRFGILPAGSSAGDGISRNAQHAESVSHQL